MTHYYIEPEVAGVLGDRTVIDRDVHPPIVKRLHLELEGWLGDVLLESFPSFVVTEEAKDALLEIGATGATFDDVEVTVTDQFEELYPGRKLPHFTWLKPEGTPGYDDIGTDADSRLVISQPVLDALSVLGIPHALVGPFDGQSER